MSDFLEYPDVQMEVKGTMADGKLKLTDEKLVFKVKSGSKQETVAKEEIEVVNWQRLAGTWGIRIFTSDGKLHRFAGFREQDRERLAKFFTTTYGQEMLDRELSYKGHNWGTANFNGSVLSFEIGSADAFEIPLPNVQNCVAGKNEVSLEFHQNDDALVNLSEIRFHIPANELAGDVDPVEAFRDQVMKKATVLSEKGDALAIFNEVNCLQPRGRYLVKVFPTYVHLHGKTFDYKIPATTMVRMFLLPHKDGRQMHLAVNCDPPIKQGQTRYHCLVFSFKEEEEEDLEIPLTEEEIKEKYEGKLEKNMSGPSYEVVSTLFRAVTGRKITQPKDFLGHSGTPAITCSHKAASGFMYPLDKGIIYIYKPPIYLRYDECNKVEFERTGGQSRSFDINITTIHDIKYTFSSIEKDEYGRLHDYLKGKKCKVVTSEKIDYGKKQEQSMDHYLAQVEAEGAGSGSSMSSDDEDFNPDTLEAQSAKEEYDSEPTTTSSEDSDVSGSGSDADRKREEKKKKKEEAKAKKAKRKESGGGEKKPRTQKTKKMTKLPGQPKKNMSAYFLWMQANRAEISAKNKGAGVAEIAKIAGAQWKEMEGTEEKKEWDQKAAEDKKRYEEEYAEWLEKGGGKEALAQAKQDKKNSKKAEKKASKSSKSTSSPSKTKSYSNAGTGGAFKSAEFIQDSDSD